MIGPTVTGIAKAAVSPAVKLIAAVRREAQLRDADTRSLNFGNLEPEMDAAIDVLSRNADRPGKALLAYVKGVISDRPAAFDDPGIAEWIMTEKVQTLVKRNVEALFTQHPCEVYAEEAAEFLSGFEGADPVVGAYAFDYAVAFVALSIIRELSPGERTILAAIEALPERIQKSRSLGRGRALLDTLVENERERIRRGRYHAGFPTQKETEEFAGQLLDGDLAGASDEVRARALACCARWQTLKADLDVLRSLVAAADRLAATEEAVLAQAFLEAQSDWRTGLAALAPINSPARASAALQMVVNGRSPAEAVDWLAQAGLTSADLDSDGRHTLLSCRLLVGDWDGAYRDATTLTDADFAATPALQNGAALARIAHVVPADLRPLVANGTPLDAATFRLADDDASLIERREAVKLLRGAQRSAAEFGSLEASRSYANSAMWLELRDPDTADEARVRLEAMLSNSDEAIAYLPLGVAFGVPMERDVIERTLAQQEALQPGGSVELALARLALCNIADDADAAADYFSRHRDLIWSHLSRAGVLEIEVRILVTAGRAVLARQRLAEHDEVLDASARERLDAVLAENPDGPSTTDLEASYARQPNTTHLTQLVTHLSEQGYSDRFFELARRLVTSTRTRFDAENLIRFLLRHNRHDEVATILADVPDVVAASADLRSALAWSKYRDGAINEAGALLAALRAERDETNDRNLFVNILITSGRWPELTAFIEDEWAARDRRSAPELFGAAQLAAQVGSPRLGELLDMAAFKGSDDPNILVGCYMLAVQAGREDDTAHQWFASAAEKSGDEGPVQMGSLEDVVSQAPDWDRHVTSVWEKVRLGEAPISVAAELLRRPSLELLLVPMIVNRDESDTRRRSVVSAFSGVREAPPTRSGSIGLDGSAVVTLAMLELLEPVCRKLGQIWIPHTMLTWLFQERQRLGFHQPSRIKAAHALMRSITAGRIKGFLPEIGVDRRLGDQVGQSMAAMLATAAAQPEGGPQRVLVRSSPIHKIGSFRGEGVDLSAFSTLLCSCQAVIDKLAERGQLTQQEEVRARTYLERNEQRWPGEPVIEDGAHLYLDDLSVAYLRTVGLLDRLHASGLSPFVSQRELEEAAALIELESRAEAIEEVIEKIRAALSDGIARGDVQIDRIFTEDELRSHPNIAAIQLGGVADAIISDDRYMNQHRSMDHESGSASIWTSLDLLNAMLAEGQLSQDDLWQHRTSMRQFGFALIPSDAKELATFVERAAVRDGELVETGELRAVRENLRLTQLRGWLSLPREAHWLNKLISDLVTAIATQWRDYVTDEAARARSRWLLRCSDMRNWAGSITDHDGSNMARFGMAVVLNSLLMRRFTIDSEEAMRRMDAWLEDEVIATLQSEEPAIYEWLIGSLRSILSDRATGSVDHG